MSGSSAGGIERYSLPDLADLGSVPQSALVGYASAVDVSANGRVLASISNASAVVRLWCAP